MNEKDVLRENIKNNLIKLRQKKGLTQADIAEETGKVKTAVASWEQGKSLPDVTTLYHLSKFYNVSLEYFYEDHNMDYLYYSPESPETVNGIPIEINTPSEHYMMKEYVKVIVNEELDRREKKNKPFDKGIIRAKFHKSNNPADSVVKVDVPTNHTDIYHIRVASADKPKTDSNSFKTVKVAGVRKARRKSEE